MSSTERQLSETETRDVLMTLAKTGLWSAHRDGTKIILRRRLSPTMCLNDLVPPALHSERETKNNDSAQLNGRSDST